MSRDEKGRFIRATVAPKYKVYSELLQKPFDSVEELEEAEKVYKEAEEKKLQEIEKRKNEAKTVTDALLNERKVIKESNENKQKLRDEYIKEKQELKDKFIAKLNDEDNKVSEATNARKKALETFLKNHPGGYHETITDPDGVVIKYDYDQTGKDAETNSISEVLKLYDEMYRKLFKFPLF